jgi:hypothetical protein
MVPFDQYHDTTAKTLLNGYTSPAGQSAQADLADALHNIAYHPNVAPFLSKQLIQHLVKSNPSPAYIARISAVFNKDASGVYGNLGSVVTAILLDPEARAGDDSPPQQLDGHMTEPALFLASTLRAMSAVADPQSTSILYEGANMGQHIAYSPDVFDYFSINYELPGTTTSAPEFAIYDPATIINRTNFAYQIAFGSGTIGTSTYSTSYWTSLPPNLLLDALDLNFLHGQMSPQLRSTIETAMSSYSSTATTQRAQQALFLVLSSPEYQVQQ